MPLRRCFASDCAASSLALSPVEVGRRNDELILARVRVMTAPERTAFLAHVRDIVDSVEDNVTSVPVESVEPDDTKDTEEAE